MRPSLLPAFFSAGLFLSTLATPMAAEEFTSTPAKINLQELTSAPSPGLEPEDVVRIQLEALRNNDTPSKDNGIRTAFRFSSPANQSTVGPIDRFTLIVKNPLYAPMINHRRWVAEATENDGELALQSVTVVAANGKVVTYVFLLSRQEEGEYAGCWMVDAVLRREAKSNLMASLAPFAQRSQKGD